MKIPIVVEQAKHVLKQLPPDQWVPEVSNLWNAVSASMKAARPKPKPEPESLTPTNLESSPDMGKDNDLIDYMKQAGG